MTSSATAAPSTVRASTVASALRSPKTRAVIPTDVAVSAAPTKSASLVGHVERQPRPKPMAMGATTPTTATDRAARPTEASSPMSISSPTSKRRRITPISPRMTRVSSAGSQPSADGPMIRPATISPTTAGHLDLLGQLRRQLGRHQRDQQMDDRGHRTATRCAPGLTLRAVCPTRQYAWPYGQSEAHVPGRRGVRRAVERARQADRRRIRRLVRVGRPVETNEEAELAVGYADLQNQRARLAACSGCGSCRAW